MIIFDLDGTLADCTHRRHFVDPSLRDDCYYHELSDLRQMEGWYYKDDVSYPKTRMKFKKDWRSFYEACDQDLPIKPTIQILGDLISCGKKVEIWSGRSDVVRSKTLWWLHEHVPKSSWVTLKMRPDRDSTPDDILKERWLDEYLASGGKPIEAVFDDRPRILRMWQRRGICTFDVGQGRGEF